MKKSDFPFITSPTVELHPSGLSGNATNAVCQVANQGWFQYHAKNPSTEEILGMLKNVTSYDLMMCKNVGHKTIKELTKFVMDNLK